MSLKAAKSTALGLLKTKMNKGLNLKNKDHENLKQAQRLNATSETSMMKRTRVEIMLFPTLITC